MNKNLPGKPTLDDLSILMDKYRLLKAELKSVKDLLESAQKLLKQRQDDVFYKENELQSVIEKTLSLITKL